MDEPKKEEENNIFHNVDSKNTLPSYDSNPNIEESITESHKDEDNNNSQNFEIEIERDNNKKKKFLSINKRNPYNISKSPTHTNNQIKNKMYNMVKLSKPFLTSKHIFLNKYSLKEVNECIYKDYNQIANILPYYQNYYYQNKISNYKNNNYSNTNNNDSILICLKYIEYSNFFFNSDISYKIQNLLFNIIIGDKGILNQNKYTFLKNKLNEVYNKLIPYQIRHNYLKAFYDRNSEESLNYLFKRDLDKINNSKPINYKKLNYLKEIYEIVKQKIGTKKEYINSYINKLLSNKNGGSYNNNLLVHNNSYSDRKQSFNQYSSNNNNISSFKYHNNNFINNEEINLYNNNTNANKEHNFKGSYPTKHTSNNYFYKNRNNSYFKQDLIEVKDPKPKLPNEEDDNINNNDEYINLMPHNNINSANNGNALWNNNINVNNMNNLNNLNINSFQGFNGNLMSLNNNINMNNRNPMQMNINNLNINGNMLQNNNLFMQQNNSNKSINKKMKINLPANNNMQNNINEGNGENINIHNINGQNEFNNHENSDLNNMDFLYNSDDNKNKGKLNSDNTLPKINFNDNNNETNITDNNTNKNISKNEPDLNILIKQMISANIVFISNINKYISQYAQLNQNLELYKSSIIEIYNQGIINNISFFNQIHHNNKNNINYNHNMNKINIAKQEKLIETDYEKLGKLKIEKPEKISENLQLFENYIILPIYNQINYINNTPETVNLYSNVYNKYKDAINSIIKENNLEGTIVEPYGSIVNNFLTSDGDIDISIVPNNISKIGFKVYLEQIEKELIKRELIEDNTDINDVNVNGNSRIYISTRYTLLTVTDLETNINIDITVHNLLPIKNTEMIRLYSLFDQRFHILGIFLKHWVKINHIKGSRNEFLSSYALLLLIIHFLQDIVEPKVLPMLQEIISEDKNKKDYDYKYCYDDKEFSTNLYYEKNFDSMREYMKKINCGKENNLTVSELLVQFFEYYGYIYNNINYNIKHYLISIKHSDKNFVANNTEHIAFPLEDPFDVNHNPSSSLKLNTPQYSDFIFCMRKEINNILSGHYFK